MLFHNSTYNAFISFNKTNYNPVENKTTFKVTKAESNIKIVVNDSEITYGDSINVTQNLPDDATGSITYMIDKNPLSTGNANESIYYSI